MACTFRESALLPLKRDDQQPGRWHRSPPTPSLLFPCSRKESCNLKCSFSLLILLLKNSLLNCAHKLTSEVSLGLKAACFLQELPAASLTNAQEPYDSIAGLTIHEPLRPAKDAAIHTSIHGDSKSLPNNRTAKVRLFPLLQTRESRKKHIFIVF